MNRERAETFLRLLAEAELRDPAAPPLHAGGATDAPFFTVPVPVRRAAWALTTAGALDVPTADRILAELELGLALRQQTEPTDPAHLSRASWSWLSRLTAPHQRGWRVPPAPAGTGGPPSGRGAPGRYVPVGLTIALHGAAITGELDLLSYAHTASGAHFTAAWRTRDALGSPRRWHHHLPPADEFALTDDRGARYHLAFNGWPNSACNLSLRPDPPDDIGWLEVTAPGGGTVRVNLDLPDAGPAGLAEVSKTDLTAGEHLLNKIAEQLLTVAPDPPRELAARPAKAVPGPFTGLGAAVAALEAAEALSPLSPVPGQLAGLCAMLRVRGHEITAAPGPDLPERWLSVLAYDQRRNAGPTLARDGFAGLAAPLPELAGVKLVLLGLHNSRGGTWMNTLAIGQMRPDWLGRHLGLDTTFPLSIWVRDSAGRWHVGWPHRWSEPGSEYALTLQVVPPLTRPTPWIDVLAAAPSAEVRASVPVRWQFPR